MIIAAELRRLGSFLTFDGSRPISGVTDNCSASAKQKIGYQNSEARGDWFVRCRVARAITGRLTVVRFPAKARRPGPRRRLIPLILSTPPQILR